jgi:ketosteroid isomerase-like protein
MTVSAAPRLSAQDRETIRSESQAYPRELLARDFEAWSNLYTEDAVLMPPNHPALHSRSALREWVDTFGEITRFEIQVDEVDGQGDVAFVRGTYEATFLPKDAPGPIDDRGKFLDIRQRQPDGRWLIHRDIFNSDLEPPQG